MDAREPGGGNAVGGVREVRPSPNSWIARCLRLRHRGLTFSFRAGFEEKFCEYHYKSLRSTVITVALVGVVLNAYTCVFGVVLLSVGLEEYKVRFELFWDFYLWSCPGRSLAATALVEPIIQGSVCLAVALCWVYAFREGSATYHRRNLLVAFLFALVVTVLVVLFDQKGELGKCATGQLCLILLIFIVPLRPLVAHSIAMCGLLIVGFTARILISGIQCDTIGDVAMISAMVALNLGSTVAANERVERAHFVAVQLARASHDTLLGLVHRMLPPEMATKLVQQWGGHVAISEQHEVVSVMFVELRLPAADALPSMIDLNAHFTMLDAIVDSAPGACKIETVGGQFVVASGVPTASASHARDMAILSMRMRAALSKACWSGGENVQFRIGVHSGPIGEISAVCMHPKHEMQRDDMRPQHATPATCDHNMRHPQHHRRRHTRTTSPSMRACACTHMRTHACQHTLCQ